jgi:uncharacterized protein (TIGR03663 family)
MAYNNIAGISILSSYPSALMKRATIVVLWICVISAGVFLRFEHLGLRPFHADEATGARITARRMESGESQFDPKHFHGPLLVDLAIPLCRMRGESCWRDLTKSTLRTLPAIAGCLLVLVPLLWRRRYGDWAMVLSAAFLATSPLLVYYSRMFIHESLLVLLGMCVLVGLFRKPCLGILGLLMGLMFATKESFAISVMAWSGAGLIIAWENRKLIDRDVCVAWWRQYRIPVGISLVVAAVTAIGFYTDGFRHAQGALDSVRTFFVYETVAGHDKPWSYYLQLFALPKKSGGVWWFETPLLALALFAYASTFRRGPTARPGRSVIRFIAYAAAGHFLIYSLIAYKTPWLACLPWAHVCLLAGFAATVRFNRHTTVLQPLIGVIAGICLVTQFYQARRVTGRYASDERNPYAYVPTRNDIENLPSWLEQLRKVAPGDTLAPIAVIGGEYWPLPWYLRASGDVGYWSAPPVGLEQFVLVLAMSDAAEAVMGTLEKSHIALPRGLRAEVPMYVFVRNDVWKRWMETGTR